MFRNIKIILSLAAVAVFFGFVSGYALNSPQIVQNQWCKRIGVDFSSSCKTVNCDEQYDTLNKSLEGCLIDWMDKYNVEAQKQLPLEGAVGANIGIFDNSGCTPAEETEVRLYNEKLTAFLSRLQDCKKDYITEDPDDVTLTYFVLNNGVEEKIEKPVPNIIKDCTEMNAKLRQNGGSISGRLTQANKILDDLQGLQCDGDDQTGNKRLVLMPDVSMEVPQPDPDSNMPKLIADKADCDDLFTEFNNMKIDKIAEIKKQCIENKSDNSAFTRASSEGVIELINTLIVNDVEVTNKFSWHSSTYADRAKYCPENKPDYKEYIDALKKLIEENKNVISYIDETKNLQKFYTANCPEKTQPDPVNKKEECNALLDALEGIKIDNLVDTVIEKCPIWGGDQTMTYANALQFMELFAKVAWGSETGYDGIAYCSEEEKYLGDMAAINTVISSKNKFKEFYENMIKASNWEGFYKRFECQKIADPLLISTDEKRLADSITYTPGVGGSDCDPIREFVYDGKLCLCKINENFPFKKSAPDYYTNVKYYLLGDKCLTRDEICKDNNGKTILVDDFANGTWGGKQTSINCNNSSAVGSQSSFSKEYANADSLASDLKYIPGKGNKCDGDREFVYDNKLCLCKIPSSSSHKFKKTVSSPYKTEGSVRYYLLDDNWCFTRDEICSITANKGKKAVSVVDFAGGAWDTPTSIDCR